MDRKPVPYKFEGIYEKGVGRIKMLIIRNLECSINTYPSINLGFLQGLIDNIPSKLGI